MAASAPTPGGTDFTVLVPALDEAERIGGVVHEARRAGARQVLVVDSGSSDATAEVAVAAGASCHRVEDLAPGGPDLGKGDALWRGLALVETEVVVFLDGDLQIDGPEFLGALLAPLASGAQLSKANFRRIRPSGVGGPGRITTLVARPLIENVAPELAWMDEPLSGQIAAPVALLRELPFEVDYGVEIGMLLDVHHRHGAAAIAHPDCGSLAHVSQDDVALSEMARQVIRAALRRSSDDFADLEPLPRPPHGS